ncbi:molybdenum cofactor guanylyltransferase [Sphingomonas immobilis]|uniref:Molybdenum cofactor guanylyltransferase n=1 Tax=Sphingomonas immobilis TaxID=3063997 RepID=A0ABT8ZZ78_9SPHN|nr:molybdenum cofactor guanylyltransferase [Sphingomonas sp. CA1-15]MDO7842893.1 molybdenum cofactor guanylyltransferase [Sphingomonas sp. CA1-15]
MISRPRVLGAVIAGGRARRFGSDKALAMLAGRPIIEHVIEALRPQADEIVICGRAWRKIPAIADRREGRIGPLAGLEAALHYAKTADFQGVLSVPVDTLPLPRNLAAALVGDDPAVLRDQHLIGYWPITCLGLLERHIEDGGRSLGSWIGRAGARQIDGAAAMVNVNTPDDLRTLSAQECSSA